MALESLSRAPERATSLPFGAIFLRAAVVAMVIGSALTLINQSFALFGLGYLPRCGFTCLAWRVLQPFERLPI